MKWHRRSEKFNRPITTEEIGEVINDPLLKRQQADGFTDEFLI